jgi:hypothetical protein
MISEAKVDLDNQNTRFLWDFEAKVDFPHFRTSMT